MRETVMTFMIMGVSTRHVRLQLSGGTFYLRLPAGDQAGPCTRVAAAPPAQSAETWTPQARPARHADTGASGPFTSATTAVG